MLMENLCFNDAHQYSFKRILAKLEGQTLKTYEKAELKLPVQANLAG